MKKVLFCAAMVAALSMAFVACGKKKAAEEEEGGAPASSQQLDSHDQGQEQGAAFDEMGGYDKMEAPAYEEDYGAYEEPKAPVNDNAALREYYVSAFEAAVAAGDYEKAYQISMEAEQKVNPEDFTPEQVQRVMNAAALIPQDFIESKGM